MSKSDMENDLDGLGSAELIRAAVSRAFWLVALLVSSAGLIVVTVVGQALGIRPSDHEWTATAMIVGFLASAVAMILCVVMWSIRHVQMTRAMQALLQAASTPRESSVSSSPVSPNSPNHS